MDQVYALVRRSVVQYARSVKEDPNLTCSSLNKTELDGGIPLSLGVNVCVWVVSFYLGRYFQFPYMENVSVRQFPVPYSVTCT